MGIWPTLVNGKAASPRQAAPARSPSWERGWGRSPSQCTDATQMERTHPHRPNGSNRRIAPKPLSSSLSPPGRDAVWWELDLVSRNVLCPLDPSSYATTQHIVTTPTNFALQVQRSFSRIKDVWVELYERHVHSVSRTNQHLD
jgi:hypothetical protein